MATYPNDQENNNESRIHISYIVNLYDNLDSKTYCIEGMCNQKEKKVHLRRKTELLQFFIEVMDTPVLPKDVIDPLDFAIAEVIQVELHTFLNIKSFLIIQIPDSE